MAGTPRPIPIADWRPDISNLDTQYASEAKNVYPGVTSYKPVQSPAIISAALASEPKGAVLARETTGGFAVFAGTQTKLYKLNTTNFTWTDVTRLVGGNYNVPDEEYWEFAQFENKLIAVNANDNPQVINIDSGTNFAVLAGSPPRARHVGVFNEFLVLNSLIDFPKRTQWSGLGDIENWTPGIGSSDFQDHPDGGFVTDFSGATGLIFQEEKIRRMTYRGDDLVFQFDIHEEDRGNIAPYSLTRFGNQSAFLSEGGFYIAAPSIASIPIGYEKVDRTFFMDAQGSFINTMVGVSDPKSSRLLFAYRSVNNAGNYFDKLLVYDWIPQRWSHIDTNIYYPFAAATAGTTLEALDALYPGGLETIPISLDSGVWQGGDPLLAAFDTSFRLVFFQGSNMEATVETAEVRLVPGGMAKTVGIMPISDSPDALATAYVRKDRADSFTLLPETTRNTLGVCRKRSKGRYHKFRVRVPAGSTWNHIQGVDVEFFPAGKGK